LASGEPAFEIDTLRLKIGDGSTVWSGLNYIGSKETLNLVRNDTGSIIYAGQTLYVSGIYNNSIPSIAKYVADGSISQNLFIGLATSNISNNSNGYATSFGQIDNLNTAGAATNALSLFGEPSWTNGTLLYAHPTSEGRLTSTRPTRAILIGSIIYAHGTQGKIFVKLNSQGLIFDNGTNVGIGTTNPTANLHVNGSGLFSSGLFTDRLDITESLNVDGNVDVHNILTIDGDNQIIIKSPDGNYILDTNGEEGTATLNNTEIGGPDGCRINKTTIGQYVPAEGYFTYLGSESISATDLLVNKGVIKVNNSYNNPFNMTINSSGISIVLNAGSTTVNYTDPIELPSFLVTDNSIDSNTIISSAFIPAGFQIGDLVLFKKFTENNAVYNGIYSIQNTSPVTQGLIRFVRASGYTNGTTLYNNFSVGVLKTAEKFILNGTSVVGTNNLIFSPDLGESVMNVASNKDVSFAEGIYAKEKYFKIQHPDPDSKYSSLQYGSLESPYHGVRLTGKDKLNKGVCEIFLPDYLKYLIHEENVSIQLTNYGHHKMLYVDKIDLKNNKFIIKGYRSKSGGPFNFYWSFTGIRKDVPNLIPEQ
jgi:hypothetical protein